MPQHSIDYNSWLKEPMLRLREIINIARGAPINDWSIRDEPDENGANWASRFRTLKGYCERGILPHTPKKGAEALYTEATIFLNETWEFLQLNVPQEQSVEWLRDFCKHKWANARNEDLREYHNGHEQKQHRAEQPKRGRIADPGSVKIAAILAKKYKTDKSLDSLPAAMIDDARREAEVPAPSTAEGQEAFEKRVRYHLSKCEDIRARISKERIT